MYYNKTLNQQLELSMNFTEDHQKYFAYIREKVLPALKARKAASLTTPTTNIEWNLKKLLGEVKADAIDAETYVNRTKADFKTVLDGLSPDDKELRKFAKDVLAQIDGFFGITPPEPVNVKQILNAKAKERRGKLDWQHSVVDLLKLLGLESDLKARRTYAIALGFPKDKISQMPNIKFNVWLHGQILHALAMNNGELPKELVA